MNINKLFAITGIIIMTAFVGVPAIAQEIPNTTQTNPGTTTIPSASNNEATGNLLEVATSNQSFSTLATAVQAAGILNKG